MKKYKIQTPEYTINQIREILNRIDLLLFEKHIFQNDFCSCRVAIGNHGLRALNIGTNGKGRTFEYSLASGYAEFMERLQNGLLLNSKKILSEKQFANIRFSENEFISEQSFTYDKQEKYTVLNLLEPVVKEEMRKMCGDSTCENMSALIGGDENVISIPFYSLKEKKIHFFPIEFMLTMTGSNGMAAGNSPKEAILQGLCEILERYVINQIYWKKLSPPTIPLENFKGTPLFEKIISYQEKRNLTLIIKDCSLGCGIPAVGLIIIDKVNQLYNFKIGVDCVPEIALERCLTEIHQGTINFHGLPFKFINPVYNNSEEKALLEKNLMKIFINGTGYWPISILEDKFSYPFNGLNRNLGGSNVTDLKYCIDLIEKMGFNIYIRDNSILGFPTYYIIIPGMSQILMKRPSELNVYTETFYKISYLT